MFPALARGFARTGPKLLPSRGSSLFSSSTLPSTNLNLHSGNFTSPFAADLEANKKRLAPQFTGFDSQSQASQVAGSFKKDTPIQKVTKPPGGFLGIGTDLTRNSVDGVGKKPFPPSGRYATNYDDLFKSTGRKSPEEVKEHLALPGSNKADGLFRLKYPAESSFYSGTVGPQGPGYGSDPAFPTDYEGGGNQIVSDAHFSQVESERVITGGEEGPTGKPLSVRGYEDLA